MKDIINQYLIRVLVFLILVLLIVVYVYPVIQSAFLSNIYINSIIIFSLIFGLFFSIFHIVQLRSDFSNLSSFNIHKNPQFLTASSKLLKNLSYELKENEGRYNFKSSSTGKIIESIDISLNGIRDTSKYLVGLLVFLGLLGTFWGLLKTIGSVGDVIGGIAIDDASAAGFFESLKNGLKAPLDGMSIAFSSSLLGLAGSLILGFVDLQLGQAQIKFSQHAEKIVINNSIVDFSKTNSVLDKSTLNAIQKIYDNLDNLVFAIKESSTNQKQLFSYMESINKQISTLSSNSHDLEKKLSNFLSTQINIQSSNIELISELSKNVIKDKKLQENLKNIEKKLDNLKIKKKI